MNITDDDYNSYDTKEKDFFHCVFSMLWYYLFGLQIVHKGIRKLKGGMITRKKRRRRHVTRIRVFVNIHIFIYVFGMFIYISVCGLQENKHQMLKSFYFLPYILNAVFSILSKTLILSSAIYFSPCFSRKWKSTSTHISSDCRFASILKKKKLAYMS